MKNSQVAMLALMGAVAMAAAPAAADSLTLATGSITGCVTVTATLSLTNAAPPGGTTFALSSSSPSVTVPVSAVVPEGALSTSFFVNTAAVSTQTLVTITANDGTNPILTRNITLRVMGPTSLSMSPNRIGPGQVSTGTVGFICPAGPADISVDIVASDPAAAPVVTPVVVPQGQQTGTFQVQAAGNVAAETRATITATANGLSRNTSLTVEPVSVLNVSFTPATPVGGEGSTGTVNLKYPAGVGGVTVALSSDAPGVAQPVVADVIVPEGATSATFGVTTTVQLNDAVAVFSASLNGITKTRVMTVRKNRIENYTVAFNTITPCRDIEASVKLFQPAGLTPFVVELVVDRPDLVALSTPTFIFNDGVDTQTFTIQAVGRVGANEVASVQARLVRSPSDTQTETEGFDVPRISTVACP
jgi:hypothetical protein